MSDSRGRLDVLRAQLQEADLAALLVPRADEYLGEYIPERNERLRWLTGFTGSAGMAVVTRDTAALFVDGRYTVQVRQQADPACFEFHHLVDTPQVPWLIQQLETGARVGCDPRVHTLAWFRTASKAFAEAGMTLVPLDANLIDRCWLDRPSPVFRQALLLAQEITGESSQAKRLRMADTIVSQGADAALVFQPDAVSWLLNVRGTDMPQLPVLLGAALLHANGEVNLYVEPARVPPGFDAHVGAGVSVSCEHELAQGLSQMDGRRVIVEAGATNAWAGLALEEAGAIVVAGQDPVLVPKACKNPTEQAGSRAAHKRDAVAVIRFLHWLDEQVADGALHDEATLSDKLLALRALDDQFHACSFDTISAAGANAAMCHYNHLNGTPASLPLDSLYLVDSGGQYIDGTTDITRTVAIGEPDREARRLFTLVLKGHIALATARFPQGTTGTQLDVLARQYLWAEGLDYDHGTGHGVGVFLSVHEGPQRISKVHNGVALQPGMIVSNEPGYYRDDVLGIRCENLVLVREVSEQLETPMLEFETISLVPFDRRLFELDMLTAAERAWLNAYHARVIDTVGPALEGADLAWLQQAAAPLPA